MKKRFVFIPFIFIMLGLIIQAGEITLLQRINIEKGFGIIIPKIMQVYRNNIFIYDGKIGKFFKINEDE